MIIGISGGSGSGKTTLIKRLCDKFGENVTAIAHDNYYKQQGDMPFERRAKINYDHPSAFDTPALINDLDALKNGKEVSCPIYDFAVHDRSHLTKRIKPTKVIMLDGILLFENEDLRKRIDCKVFLDVPESIRLERRIKRDISERGRSFEEIMRQYEETVKPMYDIFVKPCKKYADIVISNDGENDKAFEILSEIIAENIE